jgi:hypothetical protein
MKQFVILLLFFVISFSHLDDTRENDGNTFEITTAKKRILAKIHNSDNPYYMEICWSSSWWSEKTISYLKTNIGSLLYIRGNNADKYDITATWENKRGNPWFKNCEDILRITIAKVEEELEDSSSIIIPQE